MSIKFLEKWGPRSYKVSYNGAYSNPRPPHVESTDNGLTGKTFRLGARSLTQVDSNVAVTYEVIGVNNGAFPAHFTVYFGPPKQASKYATQQLSYNSFY